MKIRPNAAVVVTLIVLALTLAYALGNSNWGSSGLRASSCCPGEGTAYAAEQKSSAPVAMPDPGEKVTVNPDYYFVYGFDKKPALGMVISKVEIFTKDKKKDTSFEVIGNLDMPTMRGAHGSGDQPYKLSNKGDYLLPLNIVMPGQWELVITVLKDKQSLYKGFYRFKV